MTEAEWLACTDPERMLEALRGKASDRKLRLFAAACCRSIWHLLVEQPCRTAVEVAEKFADGDATQKDMQEAAHPLVWIRRATNRSAAALYSTWGTWSGTASFCKDFHDAVRNTADYAARAKGLGKGRRRQQAVLLRCIFGNPFRPSPPLPAAVLAWNDCTVRRIAAGIYEERTFDRLPILADALLDAGCDGEDILAHCRGAGPHVRGCWAIDLILGKS